MAQQVQFLVFFLSKFSPNSVCNSLFLLSDLKCKKKKKKCRLYETLRFLELILKLNYGKSKNCFLFPINVLNRKYQAKICFIITYYCLGSLNRTLGIFCKHLKTHIFPFIENRKEYFVNTRILHVKNSLTIMRKLSSIFRASNMTSLRYCAKQFN